MSTSNQLTQFWIEFLELYKSLPQLWKVGHEGYSHKHARTSAYAMLLEKYQEFDEGANMDHLKKKIANMRTSFRRESKKVEEDNTYTPMLWYYPHLEFLRDQEDEISEISADNEKYNTRNIKREEIEMKRLSPPRKRKKHSYVHAPKRHGRLPPDSAGKNSEHRSTHTPVTVTTPTTSPTPTSQPQRVSKFDEASTLSATWEVLYRKLHPQQKLYANRVITEVLYLGALKKLDANSYKIIENYSNNSSNHSQQQNPININVDTLDYGGVSDQISNLNDALCNLKQLENFAVRENHEAIDLIIQLEEVLKNSAEVQEVHEIEDEEDDDKDYEQEDDDDDYDM